MDTTGTSDGAVTFSGFIQGYVEDQNRLILTGDGGYYYYDAENSGYFDPVNGNSGTANENGTLSSGASLTLVDGTLGWDGSQYTWTPAHSGDVEYLVVGGGGSGSRGVYGVYYGTGGGGGGVATGSVNLSQSTNYNVIVGAGGLGYSSSQSNVDGSDGGDSKFGSDLESDQIIIGYGGLGSIANTKVGATSGGNYIFGVSSNGFIGGTGTANDSNCNTGCGAGGGGGAGGPGGTLNA